MNKCLSFVDKRLTFYYYDLAFLSHFCRFWCIVLGWYNCCVLYLTSNNRLKKLYSTTDDDDDE